MDIVFFHGLQPGGCIEAWWDTWQSERPGGTTICWPAELLGADFPRARILSVGYDSAERAGHADMTTVGRRLTSALLLNAQWGSGRWCWWGTAWAAWCCSRYA